MATLPYATREALRRARPNGATTDQFWAHSILAALWSDTGSPVIPLESKRPIDRSWQNTDVRDPEEARNLWAPGGRYYDYELGVVTGRAWIVIDLDVKGEYDGIKSFRKMCRRHDEQWPETLTVRTPSGGMHLIFEAPEGHGIGCSVGTKKAGLGPGIDVRGNGGQIVAPGSRSSAGLYRIDEEGPEDAAELPEWLSEVLYAKLATAHTADPMESVLEEGTRDTMLTSLAGSMRRRGAEPDEILAALVAINDNRCVPPKEHRDLERISWSIGTRPYEPQIEPDQEIEVDPKDFNAGLKKAETERQVKRHLAESESKRRRAILGGHDQFRSVLDCVADLPDPREATIWGIPEIGGTVGWIQGEGLLIFGPTGSHKSTLAQHIAMRRSGAVHTDLLGMPVKRDPEDRKVGYLALDRYPQIMRSVQRMWQLGKIDDRKALEDNFHAIDCLPLHVSIFDPSTLVEWLKEQNIGTLVVDSYKDLGLDPNKGEHMLGLNDAMQATLRAGIEWIGLHHTRKRTRGDRKGLDTEDASGSSWVTAGVGSSIIMDKTDDDSVTRLRHSKTPSTPIDTMVLQVDRQTAGMEILASGADAEDDGDDEGRSRGGQFKSSDDSPAALMQEYLKAHGEGTLAEIAENVQKSHEALRSAGRRLERRGIVKQLGNKWMMGEPGVA